MRILMVCSWPDWGGTEAYACRHTLELRRRGHSITFACRPGSAIQKYLTGQGIRCLPILSRLPVYPAPVLKLAAAARECDVIHAHRDRDLKRVLLAVRLTGKAVVYTRHSPAGVGEREREALRSASRIIAVSNYVREMLIQEIPADRVVTIYPGIDPDTVLPLQGPRSELPRRGLPAEGPVFGIVNQLIPIKKSDLFLHAAALLKANRPGVRYVVVGKGPERPKLEALARELGLEREVVFAGFVPDVMAVQRELTAFVSPGEQEAMPYTTLEAMASAVPVIARDVGPYRELVQDGKTGFLIPSGSVSGLTGAMGRLADDSELARSMGRAGRQRAAAFFSFHLEVDQIEELYRQAASAAPIPAAGAGLG